MFAAATSFFARTQISQSYTIGTSAPTALSSSSSEPLTWVSDDEVRSSLVLRARPLMIRHAPGRPRVRDSRRAAQTRTRFQTRGGLA